MTAFGWAPAHTVQDAVGCLCCWLVFCLVKVKNHQSHFHRDAAQPHSSWPLSLQPAIPLLSPWASVADVRKSCFLLSPVTMTFQNVAE